VVPRSSLEDIHIEADGTWKVKLTAPAIEGRANNALINLLAGLLGVAKRDVKILSGESSRLKRVRISGLDGGKVQGLLSSKGCSFKKDRT